MLDEWGATYWTYDTLGRPVSRHDPRDTVVYYGYDERGQRTELTVHGQGTVYYRYNEVGRMTSVLDGKTDMETTYEYDPAGRVTLQAHPNGATTYFSYDLSGRLQEKVTKKDTDGSVLVRFAYTRDASGDPIAIERESGLGVFYYEYDALQRLGYEGQFVDAAREYENYYEYDAAGNRTLLRHGETGAENLTYYEYNAANELLTTHDKDGWTYFSYDQNGNTVQEQKPSYTRYYAWDGRDMMTGVKSTEAGWTDNEIRYDGLASRASLLDSTGFTYYTWDGINVIQEKDAAGDITQRQVHGYAPIVSVGDIALVDKAAGSAYVPVADQVGTIWDLADSSAGKANSYAYDAFGVDRSVSESVTNRCRFGTKRLDSGSDLCHFVARQYAPIVGMFSSRDRTGRGGGRGYALVRARVLRWTDPTGRCIVLPPEAIAEFLLSHPDAMAMFLDAYGYPVGEDFWDLVGALEEFAQQSPVLYDILSNMASGQTIPPVERPKPKRPYTPCPSTPPVNDWSAWCKDIYTPFHHGRTCYRELNCRYMCQQCCYGPDPTSADYIEESADYVSPASGQYEGFCCFYNVPAVLSHILIDVAPLAL
jgi:RHS repeat-associated protein